MNSPAGAAGASCVPAAAGAHSEATAADVRLRLPAAPGSVAAQIQRISASAADTRQTPCQVHELKVHLIGRQIMLL